MTLNMTKALTPLAAEHGVGITAFTKAEREFEAKFAAAEKWLIEMKKRRNLK
jgi:hypothetical protein